MKKRSVKISGHATSVSLENEFWDEIKKIATLKGLSLNDYISEVDKERHSNRLSAASANTQDHEIHNLSSALRLAVLNHYKKPITL